MASDSEGDDVILDDDSERMFLCMICRTMIMGYDNFAKHNEENHAELANPMVKREVKVEVLSSGEEDNMSVEEEEVKAKIDPDELKPVAMEEDDSEDVKVLVDQGRKRKRDSAGKQSKITDFLGRSKKAVKVEEEVDVKIKRDIKIDSADDDSEIEHVEPEEDDIKIDVSKKEIKTDDDVDETYDGPDGDVEGSDGDEEEIPDDVAITEEEYASSFRFNPADFGFDDSILDKAFKSYIPLSRCDAEAEGGDKTEGDGDNKENGNSKESDEESKEQDESEDEVDENEEPNGVSNGVSEEESDENDVPGGVVNGGVEENEDDDENEESNSVDKVDTEKVQKQSKNSVSSLSDRLVGKTAGKSVKPAAIKKKSKVTPSPKNTLSSWVTRSSPKKPETPTKAAPVRSSPRKSGKVKWDYLKIKAPTKSKHKTT